MRFLVDGMLGGLARWLRMLGHDVKYETDTADSELLQIADKENMILLTCDAELSRRANAKKLSTLLIVEKTEEERLAQIARTFGISLDPVMAKSKCPECDMRLIELSRAEVEGEVPETSLTLYETFWKCSECGKVYWQGSHWKQIRQTLRNAKKISGLSQ